MVLSLTMYVHTEDVLVGRLQSACTVQGEFVMQM